MSIDIKRNICIYWDWYDIKDTFMFPFVLNVVNQNYTV